MAGVLRGRLFRSRQNTNALPQLISPDPRRDPGAWDCDLQYSLTGSGKSRLLVAGKYVIQQAYIRNSAIDYPEMDEPMNDNERESFQRTVSRYKTLKAASTIKSAYYSDEITNLNGIFIPIRFHADLGLEDVSDYSDRFVGVVTNIVIAETTNLMPPLRGLITVEDRRMRYKDSSGFRKDLYYKLSQNLWPTDTNDAQLRSIALRRPPTNIMEISSRPEKLLTVKVLFVMLLLLLLLMVFMKWFRSKGNK